MSEPSNVKLWEQDVQIPTYRTGLPDKNPMFLEKRVYQGSSGKVYPYPVVDKIEDERTLQTYRVVFLENEYLQIQIMPELGGRIYRALDKTNNYDFVYYNRVIKPALVGLTGPWISGGIEFNWPQHHRPNTFGPVECTWTDNEDGSKTVWVSEIDRMYGTKGMAGFTLYPGKAYLEIKGQLYNRTPLPQTFLWWANPAVAVNDHTQSIFPPDVNAVFDHGKRDVSKFPIATGTYYKMDYSAGVDISRYKNIPVPTSYMAYHSNYNFVGGYDHSVRAGILHVANHHISPGKKQWTWGNGDFGQAWDRQLTDEDGPYIELMTGVFTDNQPDFTWLQPYEEKSFKQYFMPYKEIGEVKNASIDAAINLERIGTKARIRIYATSVIRGACIRLADSVNTYLAVTTDLTPQAAYERHVELPSGVLWHQLTLSVLAPDGRELVSYTPAEPQLKSVPEPQQAIGLPEQLPNNEALYLAGLHLEQYRHATREPEAYYEEGLKRDSGDIRINNAYGLLLLRRGQFAASADHFRRAVATATRHNPNPYDGEAHYNLGLALKLQGKWAEAYEAYYKSSWSDAWQDKAWFALAQLACGMRQYEDAIELAELSLTRNTRNIQARNVLAAAYRRSGQYSKAASLARETIRLDIADGWARNELILALTAMGQANGAETENVQLGRLLPTPRHYLTLAQDYADSGLREEAADILRHCLANDARAAATDPLISYSLAHLNKQVGEDALSAEFYEQARTAKLDYCFPTTLWDLRVLSAALDAAPDDSHAHYLLGNLLYDKRRHLEAIRHWERAVELDGKFPTALRNLALACFNKLHEPDKARQLLERAFQSDSEDARVFYELDQLHKKLGTPPAERLTRLESRLDLVERRDDLYTEFVTLLNTLERHTDAKMRIMERKFHPWEGGEGKITSQYVISRVEIAKEHLAGGRCAEAADELTQAKVYPDNLGEGKLAGAQENQIHYYLGCALLGGGSNEDGKEYLRIASQGLEEPAGAMFYNDQPPETIFYQGLALLKLHQESQARSRFNKLIDYGESHLFKPLMVDYFAVSLPDFLVFDENLDKKNEIHCRFMMALGYLGLGRRGEAIEQFKQVLALDPAHQGALIHARLCE